MTRRQIPRAAREHPDERLEPGSRARAFPGSAPLATNLPGSPECLPHRLLQAHRSTLRKVLSSWPSREAGASSLQAQHRQGNGGPAGGGDRGVLRRESAKRGVIARQKVSKACYVPFNRYVPQQGTSRTSSPKRAGRAMRAAHPPSPPRDIFVTSRIVEMGK